MLGQSKGIHTTSTLSPYHASLALLHAVEQGGSGNSSAINSPLVASPSVRSSPSQQLRSFRLPSQSTHHSTHASSSGASVLQNGGMIILRGTRCSCDTDGSIRYLLSNDTSTNATQIANTPQTNNATLNITLPSSPSFPPHSSDASGPASASQSSHASAHLSSSAVGAVNNVRHHTSLCMPALIKTTSNLQPHPEQTAILRFELMAFQRLHDRNVKRKRGELLLDESSSGATNVGSARAASENNIIHPAWTLSQSNSANNSGNTSASNSNSNSLFATQLPTQRYPALPPELVTLTDSRLALVLAQEYQNCMNLKEFMTVQFAPSRHQRTSNSLHSSNSSHSLTDSSTSSVPKSDPSASSGPTAPTTVSTNSSVGPVQHFSYQHIQCVLQIGLQLCEALSQLHLSGLVHKHIMPSSLLIYPDTKQISFLDLSHSSLLYRDQIDSQSTVSEHAMDYLPYISPEQTGKANRSTDNRSDLYSVGAILYECISGYPPFAGHHKRTLDSIEIIHMHVAATPAALYPTGRGNVLPPCLGNPLILLNSIVMKLLSKSADERYQSAGGLAADLKYCLNLLESVHAATTSTLSTHCTVHSATHPAYFSFQPDFGTANSNASEVHPIPRTPLGQPVGEFRIGQLDDYSTFRLSQKLYGRDKQIDQLIAAYDRIRADPSELGATNTNSSSGWLTMSPQLILIDALSGIGKTALCDEMHKIVLKRRGLFARGRFDVYKRDSSCILAAFRDLMIQLLVQNTLTWKVKILRAVGGNAQVLIESIPELERIVGPQPPVPSLPLVEAQARFQSVFQQFLSVFATSEMPLVLALESVQWADAASVKLIKLMHSLLGAHLLLIVCYRPNEVDENSPLTKLINELIYRPEYSSYDLDQQGGTTNTIAPSANRVEQIHLNPIDLEDTTEFVCDSFRCSREKAVPFATLLLGKSLGSPFFIAALLKSFHDTGLLSFDFHAREWKWDLAAMKLTAVSEDVVDIVCVQLKKLNEHSQTILKLAACTGNRFTMGLLATISQMPVGELAHYLCELEQTGLIIATAHSSELFLLASEEEREKRKSSKAEPVTQSIISAETNSQTLSPTSPANIALDRICFRFAHDKICSAAYRLIPTNELASLHMKIAQLMLNNAKDPSEVSANAMNLSTHINASIRMQLEDEKQSAATLDACFHSGIDLTGVIRIELEAGRQAKAVGAHSQALPFFKIALLLLPHSVGLTPTTPVSVHSLTSSQLEVASEECWKRNYDLCYEVHLAVTECLYSTFAYEAAIEFSKGANVYVKPGLHRVQLIIQQVGCHIQMSELTEAMEVGMTKMKTIGVQFLPNEPTNTLKAWIEDIKNGVLDWNTYPEIVKDDFNTLAPALFLAISSALIFTCSEHKESMTWTALNFAREKGVSPASAMALAMAAPILLAQGDMDGAASMIRAAQSLLQRFQQHRSYKTVHTKVATITLGLIGFLSDSATSIANKLMDVYDECKDCGDVEWLSYIQVFWTHWCLNSGLPLPLVLERQSELMTDMINVKQDLCCHYLHLEMLFCKKLMGVAPISDRHEYIMQGNKVTDLQLLERIKGQENYLALYRGYEVSTKFRFIVREIDVAVERGQLAYNLLKSQPQLGYCSQLFFYYSLALCASAPTLNISSLTDPMEHLSIFKSRSKIGHTAAPTGRIVDTKFFVYNSYPHESYDAENVQAILSKVDEMLQILQSLAAANPNLFYHKMLLVEAERQRVVSMSHMGSNSQFASATALYMEAMSVAKLNGYLHEEALAGELYARYLMAIGWCATVGPALVCLKDCYIAYEKWGATVKLQQLVDEFPFLSSCDIEQSTVLASAADSASGARVPLPLDSRILSSNSNVGQKELRQSTNDTLKPGSVMIVAGSGGAIPPSSPTPTLTPSVTHRTRQSSDNKELNQNNQSFTHGTAITASAPTGSHALHHRDLLPIVKAIQTISVEKNWKKLLKKLMSIVLQSAGATRGILVLEDPDASEWRVELAANVEAIENEDVTPERSKSASVPATPVVTDETSVDTEQTTAAQTSASTTESSSDSFKTVAGDATIHLLLDEVPLLEDAVPMSIFHFCRTSKETIVICEPDKLINSAFSAFAEDAYFSKHHPKAVLCCPVLKGGSVVGVLYLENDGHASAFTSAHIQLLQLLCSQAALSIDNARLWFRLQMSHASLEATVKERTLELEERNAQLLRAKEEAEKATLSKSAFLSNMSHEIRTPLNAVLGISRLLADTPLTLEQDQYLSMISNSGHLLLTIINDVLDYSKIEANQLKLELVPYSLIDAVETAVMLCHDAASTKRLDLHYYIQPDAPHIFLIDAMRLQQILLNLLSNGIKFCNAGEVGLTVECQQIRGREYELIFHVRDQGIGIHPSDIAKLFQSFSQVGTSQAKASGTGLGLVISKRLAEAMQGRIWCSSEVGRGSVFSFSIHAKVPDDTPVPPSLPNQADVPLWPQPSKEKVAPDSQMTPFTPVLPALVSPHQLTPPGTSLAMAFNPYQLSGADCELLRNSRVVLLGHRVGSLKVWSQLLDNYGCVTHVEYSSAAAFQYISEHYSNSMSSGKIDLLLLENYDSWSMGPSASENESIEDLIDSQVFNVLVNYTPLALLFLTDRYYHASSTRTTPVALTRTLTPTSSNGTISQSSLSQALSDANLAKQMITDRLRPDGLNKPMTAAEKLALANEAAVAKLQTRSPALMNRRLMGKADTVVSPIQGINSPVVLPRPSSTRSTSSNTSAMSSSSTALTSYGRFTTDELSMPFKHRDFLLCIAKQLQRLKEAPASHVSSPGLIITNGTVTPPSYDLKPEISNSLSLPNPNPASLLPESPHETVNPPDIAHASSVTASIPTSVLAPTTVRSRTSKAQREPIQNIARQHPLKILLCEDNLINQRMMVMMLRKLGYEIQVAVNGKECLEILAREASKGPTYEIECILMDASMDVMNGEECTRVIRMQQLPHRKRPYIIAQTANASEEFRRQCIDCGMDSFLAKPINLGELVTALLEAYGAKAAGKSASPPASAVGSASTASDSEAASVVAISPIVPILAPAVPPKAETIN